MIGIYEFAERSFYFPSDEAGNGPEKPDMTWVRHERKYNRKQDEKRNKAGNENRKDTRNGQEINRNTQLKLQK